MKGTDTHILGQPGPLGIVLLEGQSDKGLAQMQELELLPHAEGGQQPTPQLELNLFLVLEDGKDNKGKTPQFISKDQRLNTKVATNI
jgi:hypothetical protein